MLFYRKTEFRAVNAARVLLTSAALMLTLSAAPAMAANPPKQLTLAELGEKVQALADRAEIEDLISGWYKLGLAMKGADFGSYFTEDGVMDLNGKVTKGAKEIQAFFDVRPATQVYCIYATNLNIVINGDTATAEYIYLVTIGGDTTTDNAKVVAHGIEHDQLAKRNGRWVFKRREIRRV